MKQRATRIVCAFEDPTPPRDHEQVHRVRAFISALALAWAITATHIVLSLWMTAHGMRNSVRDGCGDEERPTLSTIVECFPLRMVAGMFNDTSAPHDEVASVHGVGLCPDANGQRRH